MALIKNIDHINFGGGGELWLNEDLEETVYPDGPGWFEVGYLDKEGTKISDSYEYDEIRNENNDLIKTYIKNKKVIIDAFLLQTSKSEIDFIDQAGGKTYQAYYTVVTENDINQAWHFPKVKAIKKEEIVFNMEMRKIGIQLIALKKD